MGLSIEEILAQASPRVEWARVCIDGELIGEHSRLTRELEELQRASEGKMAAAPEARAKAQQIVEVEAAMEKAKVPFKFVGIGPAALSAIMARFPGQGSAGWNVEAGAAALIAACAAEPKMTEAQAGALCEKIAGGATELFNAAWRATNSATNIPPSVRASALISGSGSK